MLVQLRAACAAVVRQPVATRRLSGALAVTLLGLLAAAWGC